MGSLRRRAGAILFVLLAAGVASAQSGAPPVPAQAEQPRDALGRDTPRGTVLGFMDAAREANDETAPLYLDSRLRDGAATDLAHKLFVVLDRRLPPRLNELSDRPEGSLADPLRPNENLVGTIVTGDGPLDVVVERVDRGTAGHVWLFSARTLAAIPDAYDEIDLVSIDQFVPGFLTKPRLAGIRLAAWLALVVILPVGYVLTGLPDRLLRPAAAMWARRRGSGGALPARLIPGAVRLLLLAILIRWLLAILELPLLERQFWTSIATLLVLVAAVWIVLLLNGSAERHVLRRVQGSRRGELAALLRLTRRVADVLAIAAGVLITLHYVGINPTAALAGLGIGGIAVALSAQKTLENVVGGLSIIFDRAVQVGDFVKFEGTLGTVDYIGLRSTRIRTLDRTVLGVPNGQLANVSIETFSARDKFWFHHVVGLRFETTSAQMRAIVDGIRDFVAAHPSVDRGETIRARFLRVGPFSLDVEVFAYVLAGGDWDRFLEIQQDLLLGIVAVVECAGASLALPSQTLHLSGAWEEAPAVRSA